MAVPPFECPRSWTAATLEPDARGGIIACCGSGGTPRTTREDYWDGDVPWLTPKEITRRGEAVYVSHTERTITQTGLANSAAKLLTPSTVLLTKRAPVGAVAVNAVPMCTNQGFLNFTCGPKLRPLYLAYWLRANVEYLQQVANGSTYRELYKSDLFEFEIAVPPLSEQDAIIQAIGALQFLLLQGAALEQSASRPVDLLRLQDEDRRLRSLVKRLMIEFLAGRLAPADCSRIAGDSICLANQ